MTRRVSKTKMGSPDMENQTRKNSKLPDCIKRMLKVAKKYIPRSRQEKQTHA